MIASFWNKLWSSVTSKCTFWFTSRTSGLTMSTFPIPLLHFDWCSFSSVGSKNIFPQFEHGQVLNWKKKPENLEKVNFTKYFNEPFHEFEYDLSAYQVDEIISKTRFRFWWNFACNLGIMHIPRKFFNIGMSGQLLTWKFYSFF